MLLAILCTPANAQDADTSSIVAWNKIALRTTKTGAPAIPAMRNVAMVHIAIHDALNAISPRYKPYYHADKARAGASPAAAIATAAHAVLAALYPAEQAKLDADLAASLASLPDSADKSNGIELGRVSAAAVLQARASDRMNDKVAYTPEPRDGIWRPVPGDGIAPTNAPRGPDNAPPLAPQWGRMVPLALERSDQFRPDPPPSITSEAYARDFRELIEIGGAGSAKRTQEQTDLALFWRPTPDLLFDPVVQQLVIDKKMDAWQAANAFALVNVVMVDAVIACWDAKYTYNQWRPITGIRNPPADSHPSIKADPNWSPLLFTPPYPDYPAGHPTATAAAMLTMKTLFGSKPESFVVVAGGKSREYTSFDVIAEEVVNARVYGGVHWRTSDVVGAQLGQRVAEYILMQRQQ